MKGVLVKFQLAFFVAVLITGCAAQNSGQSTSNTSALLESGYEKLSSRKAKDAISDFDSAIALCESQYPEEGQRVYATRGGAETIYYMLKAANDGEPAIAVDTTCSDAYYLRGYASLDLGQIEIAEQYLRKAVDMAPINAMYLSELGHISHAKRDWKRALELFTEAELAAEKYSPPDLRDAELSRAKRGVGFSLIELDRLDEAEVKFQECLAINGNDKMAQQELQYIESLRNGASEAF